MLHDPTLRPQPITAATIGRSPGEKEVLRGLVSQISKIAALPVHKEKADLWRPIKDLESVRSMVWINVIPWREMNLNDELTLQTERPWAREWETTLRQTTYQWRHLPADMVVGDYIECPLAIQTTDFGIIENVDLAKADEANNIVSRHFKIQTRDWEDLEKIQMSRITHVEDITEERFKVMSEICKHIMPLRRTTSPIRRFSPVTTGVPARHAMNCWNAGATAMWN